MKKTLLPCAAGPKEFLRSRAEIYKFATAFFFRELKLFFFSHSLTKSLTLHADCFSPANLSFSPTRKYFHHPKNICTAAINRTFSPLPEFLRASNQARSFRPSPRMADNLGSTSRSSGSGRYLACVGNPMNIERGTWSAAWLTASPRCLLKHPARGRRVCPCARFYLGGQPLQASYI